jgi:ATP phosphoribosyltransferase
LVELEVIREISARVVVNTASNKLKHEALTRLLARLRSACAVPA